MPFIDYISLDNNDIIGLWKNDENLEDLLFTLQPKDGVLESYNRLRIDKRRKEYCITQLLLKELTDDPQVILKDEHGKPSLSELPYKISISHANVYSAVMLSEKQECGVDVEMIKPRIKRIAKKFVSDYENLYVSEGKESSYYTIIWCVKEAIYKWYAKRGVDFKQHMIIHPFTMQQSGGPVYFEFVYKGKKTTNIAHYRLFNRHIIAWVVAPEFDLISES